MFQSVKKPNSAAKLPDGLRYCVAICLIALILCRVTAYAQTSDLTKPKIKNALAKRLALVTAPVEHRHTRNFLLSNDKDNIRQFIILQYVYNWTGLGFFAVNRWTGAVWDIWACEKVSTPESDRTKVKIRTWFTPEELKQYDQLDSIRPICVDDRYRGYMHENQ